jgi:hypothetical protein
MGYSGIHNSIDWRSFYFLVVFTPLFAFSFATENFTLFFFLLLQWIWMFSLIISNTFNIFDNFLLKIKNYFSSKACLHCIVNYPNRVFL